MDVWLQTQTLLGRLTGRGPWYRTTPVQDATNMRHWNCTRVRSHAVLRLLSCRPLAVLLTVVPGLTQEAVLLGLTSISLGHMGGTEQGLATYAPLALGNNCCKPKLPKPNHPLTSRSVSQAFSRSFSQPVTLKDTMDDHSSQLPQHRSAWTHM